MSFNKVSKEVYRQVLKEVLDREHFDNEISMARSQLEAIADKALKLSSLLKNNKEGLEAWVQYKINQAKDDITGVHDYMVYTPGLNESLEIKETSISDIHKMKEDGKSSDDIAKELKLNPGLVKRILGEGTEKDNTQYPQHIHDIIKKAKEKETELARQKQLSNIKAKITNVKVPGYTVEETIKEANEVDFVKIDIPLFIRLLEFAREDAKKDLDLHYLTTNLLKMKDKVASMPDYEKIVKMPVKEDVTADNMNAKQKLKVLAGIEDIKKNTDTDEIGSIKKEEVLPERKITGTVNLVKEDEEFKPHDMYDPKTGEKQHVTTYAKHLELKNKGWGHEAPKKEQVKEVKNCGCGQTPCITYGTQNIDKTVEEHIVKVKGGYQLQSKSTGKNLGTYPTKAGAEKRERQVQYFKHNESSWDAFGGYENKPMTDLEQKEPTGKLKDACWPGYTAVGFKMKNGKRVPNCVPKSEAYKGAKSIVEKAWKKLKEKK